MSLPTQFFKLVIVAQTSSGQPSNRGGHYILGPAAAAGTAGFTLMALVLTPAARELWLVAAAFLVSTLTSLDRQKPSVPVTYETLSHYNFITRPPV